MTFRLPVHRIVRYTLYCTSVLGLFGDRTFRGSVIDSGIYLFAFTPGRRAVPDTRFRGLLL